MPELTCAELIDSHYESTMGTIKEWFDVGDWDSINEYGLCFDYVEPDFYDDQPNGFWRWQLSWGGPADEIRFYVGEKECRRPYQIEYRYHDWFDGAGRSLDGVSEAMILDIFNWFRGY